MSISNLIEGLQKANLSLTPREIAELLWLWVKTAPEEESTIPKPISERPQLITSDIQDSSTNKQPSPSTVVETLSQPSKVDLYPKVIDQNLIEQPRHQEQRYPLQVPDAPAISNQRQLERSLKSLRRSFKSLREQKLDVNQTIDTIVEQTLSNPNSPIWMPIFKPTFTRRWLNLVLVIEVNNSLVIWKQTITELRQLLRRLGIFNSFETWGLQINLSKTQVFLAWLFKLILSTSPEFITFLIVSHQKEGIQLFRYDDPQMRPHPPEAINSRGRETLILLVSDLVSPAWYRPEIYTLLRQWSRKGMVNLLQLLPERLWSRTILGQQNRLKLQATTQTTRNHKLISLSSAKTPKLDEFKLSVTSLEPDRLEEWSKFLIGMGDNQCIGYGITSPQISPPKPSLVEITPQERITRFQSIASPTALKLAELLSAVLVTLPVIRVIQYIILPNSNQSHIAEVLMGGLFQPLTERITPNINPDEIEFKFFAGVREELLSWLTVPEITSTIEKVSAYLADKMGISLKDFEALLMSSKNLNSDLAKQIYPFAQVSSEVLQKLGGAYAIFAKQIKGMEGSSILQEFAGKYICAVKRGDTWYEGLENLLIPLDLLISPQGEVQFGSQLGFAVIKNLTVKGQTLSWNFDGNQSAASITFKENSEDIYFWEEHQTGKLFEGWLQYLNEDRKDFRGRFEVVLPPLQEFTFKVRTIILIDDSINPETFNFEVAVIKVNQSSQYNNNILGKVNEALFNHKKQHLTHIEQQLLSNALYNSADEQISDITVESLDYHSSPHEENLWYAAEFKLWQVLTEIVGEQVNKSNVKYLINKWAARSRLTIDRYSAQATGFIQDLDSDTQLEMMLIPGGTFAMGSLPEELEHQGSESPQHIVTVQPFFMGKYPVTQAQWRFVAQLPQVNHKLDLDPSEFKGENRPVERVSWEDAVEFCSRLSQYTGRPYRLPSEAEWEYACRAGTTTPFHFGETITSELANYNASYVYGSGEKGIYRKETTDVGSFGVANDFGLYDMHGNVWEWCADNWHNSYEGAPTDGSAWLSDNDNDNQARMLRGGSWVDLPAYCRSAYRFNLDAGDRYGSVGFRVACSAA